MPVTSPDNRMSNQTPPPQPRLKGSFGTLVVDVFGGDVANVQAGVFDSANVPLSGFGITVAGVDVPALDTGNGPVTWHIDAPQNAAYLQWGISVVRTPSSVYSVTVTIMDATGNVLATGKYNGSIPDNANIDAPVYDKVIFS